MTATRSTAQPIVVDGVPFRCYHTGFLRSVWRAAGGRIEVERAGNSPTYRASVNGAPIRGSGFNGIERRFLTQNAAMRAAIKIARERGLI